MSKLAPISVPQPAGYLREQRQAAQLSLRQLSEVCGSAILISRQGPEEAQRGDPAAARPGSADPGAHVERLGRDPQTPGELLQDLRAGLLQAPLDLREIRIADPRNLRELPRSTAGLPARTAPGGPAVAAAALGGRGVSNPYLSQIQRGLKKSPARRSCSSSPRYAGSRPSRSTCAPGSWRSRPTTGTPPWSTSGCGARRPTPHRRQRSVLLDVYESFVGDSHEAAAGGATPTPTTGPTGRPMTARRGRRWRRARDRRTARSRRLHRKPRPGVARRRRPPAALARRGRPRRQPTPPPRQEIVMTLVTDIRRTVTDNSAVYVAVGVTDLAVEKVRDALRPCRGRPGALLGRRPHRAPGPRGRPGPAGAHAGVQPHPRDRRQGPGVLRRPGRAGRQPVTRLRSRSPPRTCSPGAATVRLARAPSRRPARLPPRRGVRPARR